LVGVLAHELQHAVAIARAPEVRDDEKLQDYFNRASLSFSCAGMCYETQEAEDVQHAVNEELAARAANPRRDTEVRRSATFLAPSN
jgi:hypothetical protein